MAWMLKAIDEGCDCRGFLNWTFTDNLSLLMHLEIVMGLWN